MDEYLPPMLNNRWNKVAILVHIQGAPRDNRMLCYIVCIAEHCQLIVIGSDNDLSPGRRQAIILTNAGILLIGTLGTNFNEIVMKFIHFH